MKTRLMLAIILIMLSLSSVSFARYRAFKYLIKDRVNGDEYTVVTGLEPRVFINYYESSRSFREISVISTWMCWGNTSYFKKVCPDPREVLEPEPEVEEFGEE